MKIGEFAKVCDTRISVLRHYDKEKLLIPVYIDRFTGYRYYSQEQIPVFFRITALKQAGFSLAEIREMVVRVKDDTEIIELFDQKEAEIKAMLQNLKSAKKMMLGADVMIHVVFHETEKGTFAKSGKVNANYMKAVYEQMDNAIAASNYQRISAMRLQENPDNTEQELVCEVVKLNKEIATLKENIQLPFENDEAVIGKWETIGEYAVKDEFYEDRECRNNWYDEYPNGIYFLPDGESYWCYAWTKGFVLRKWNSCVCAYEIRTVDDRDYLIMEWKSGDYRWGGLDTDYYVFVRA